ncbi:MAG: hypothetical protein ACLFVU_08435 [Phycisphaerae bacterium]
MRRILILMAVMAGLFPAVLSGQEPGDGSEKIEPLIETIENAERASTAVAAYARANAYAPKNAELHKTQMHTLLRFGLPEMAMPAAKRLVQLEPDNAIAWGLIGYMQARRGDWPAALVNTINAVKLDPDNSGTIRNLGLLLAWYDNELDIPRLPHATRRAMVELRDELKDHKAFTSAYDRVEKGFEKFTKAERALLQELTAAESTASETMEQVLMVDQQIRQVNSRIHSIEYTIDQYYYGYRYSYPSYGYGGHGGYGYGYDDLFPPVIVRGRAQRFRHPRFVSFDNLHFGRHRIGEVEALRDEIDNLQGRRNVLRVQGRSLLAELAGERDRVRGLRRQMDLNPRRLDRAFLFYPPELNGKIPNDFERVALGKPGKIPVVLTEQEQAAKRLKLVELYVQNEMPSKALSVLRDIIETWPKTPAARRARKVLNGIRNGSDAPATTQPVSKASDRSGR